MMMIILIKITVTGAQKNGIYLLNRRRRFLF